MPEATASVVVASRIPRELDAKLTAAADECGLNRSRLLGVAIEQMLELLAVAPSVRDLVEDPSDPETPWMTEACRP